MQRLCSGRNFRRFRASKIKKKEGVIIGINVLSLFDGIKFIINRRD